jgi:hypothetical protein
VGPQGPVGATGAQGLEGINGAKGDKGDKGDVGPIGSMGPQGPVGATGAQGLDGINGAKGDKGDVGPIGPMGPQGLQGPVGEAGLNGSDATVNITSGIGIISDIINGIGTIRVDVGTNAGQIPQIQPNGKLANELINFPAYTESKVAILKDLKGSGIQGGTSSASTWQTRDLNVLSGDSSFVSLSGNQFTLQAGSYLIRARVPGYMVNGHKAALFSGDSIKILGSSSNSHATYPTTSYSEISGVVTVATSETFSIKHRTATERNLVGLGIANNFGVDEEYTVVEIIKFK